MLFGGLFCAVRRSIAVVAQHPNIVVRKIREKVQEALAAREASAVPEA